MAERRTISEAQQKIVDTNLVNAVSSNDREKIELCLKKGADINARSSWYNRTSLMMAVAYGREDTVVYLLTKNPDLFLKDSEGKTVYEIVNDIRDSAVQKKINRLLLAALPDCAPAAPEASAAEAVTQEDIQVLKPITLQPKKGGSTFQL
ncbi:MAG: ankyrin repeat domain-containing protein [Alphaproteobacteria bacterium]